MLFCILHHRWFPTFRVLSSSEEKPTLLQTHLFLLLLQIYSLNIEFYQLQATNTKTGRPAQWALATWAPEGPVSST